MDQSLTVLTTVQTTGYIPLSILGQILIQLGDNINLSPFSCSLSLLSLSLSLSICLSSVLLFFFFFAFLYSVQQHMWGHGVHVPEPAVYPPTFHVWPWQRLRRRIRRVSGVRSVHDPLTSAHFSFISILCLSVSIVFYSKPPFVYILTFGMQHCVRINQLKNPK